MNYSDVGVSVDNLGNLCNQIGFLSFVGFVIFFHIIGQQKDGC